MSDAPRSSLTRSVLIAGLITLVVTGLRLLGEKEGWNPIWFGAGFAVVGISWLPIVFGFWFGRQLVKGGRSPGSMRRALILPVVGFLLVPGTWAVCTYVLKVPAETLGFAVGGAAWVGALLALVAWPALFGVNLFYALLARLPVIAVIWLAVTKNWDVHYTRRHPDAPALAGNDLAMVLTMTQIGFWIPYTIMVGGFFGALAAGMRRK
jgi:hypothetical protein